MFSIYDGREHFFQWDTKQRLIVEDATIEQVHFCNRTDDCSLKREVYNEGGKRIVNVPDLLLQDNWRIHAYAWDGNATKHEDIFNVEPRTKPQNYVYTEEEITTYEALEKRLDQIEENGVSDEVVAAAVKDYLIENPIETGATEEEAAQIQANKAAIVVLEQEAATHATETYVNQQIANAQLGGGEVDLSDYYTKAQTDAAINAAKPDLTTYATQKWVEDKKYLTQHQDLSAYALKTEIPSLDGYAKTTDIPDVSGFQTAAQVQTAIENYVGVIENGTY